MTSPSVPKSLPLPSLDLETITQSLEPLKNELRKKTILLTGGTGFLGRWLVESFLHFNHRLDLQSKLFVVSRNPHKFLSTYSHLNGYASLQFIAGDVRDFPLPTEKIDFVLHAASDVTTANSEELIDVAVRGTERLLELSKEAGVKKFLFLSSGAVYGEQPSETAKLSEAFESREEKLSAYGEAKRRAENLLFEFSRKNDLQVVSARCFSVIGPGLPLDGHFAAGNFIKNAISNENIAIKGNGEAVRSFIYAADLATWIWTLLLRGKSGEAYNVGSEESLTIFELAKKIASQSPGLEVKIEAQRAPSLASNRYLPTVEKAQALGLKTSVRIDEAIMRTYSYCAQVVRK